MCRDRTRFRVPGLQEVRLEPKDAGRSSASSVRLTTRILSRFTSFPCSVAAASALFRQVRTLPTVTPLTNSQPPLHPQPPSPMHPPFALADSPPAPPIASTAVPNPPKQALNPLHTSLIQPPSVAWIRARQTHPRVVRATGHHQKRDFGAAGSLMRQHDRVWSRCCCP